MPTIMPDSELRRKAVAYISERLAGGRPLRLALDEAAMRFNLSPKDAEFLTRFFSPDRKED